MIARDVLLITPTTRAMLTAVSAEVLAVALPVVASFLPGCSSMLLSARIDTSWVIPEVSSMSSLELRSAVLVIQVRTLCVASEKATAPPTWMVALAPDPPAPELAVYLAATRLKMLSKADEPRSHITSSLFSSTSSATKPALALAVSEADSAEPMPKVRKVESRMWVAVMRNGE